jgi:tRNA threonylcarbamoyladenosine biosynthesis protein TsaB
VKLLAIETATDACSAALIIDGECQQRYALAPRAHTELILPMVDELMAEAGLSANQLDVMAFGRGPGAFTGVRIAVGVAQGIAFAADLPVVPVSTLAALAQGLATENKILAALDARMDEVYWGAYQRNEAGLMVLVGDECVSAPAAVPLPTGQHWHGAGAGWASYETQLVERCKPLAVTWQADCFPHAADVAQLAVAAYDAGQAVSAEQALPVYLRDTVTWKKIR